MIRFVCWNMGYKQASWRTLAGMDADVATRAPPRSDEAGLMC